MAKRFTDTDKWKREWFYELKPHAKLAWIYLLDQCDHCGIWPRNFKLMSELLGIKIDHAHFVEWFGSKIQLFDGDKYFIPSFFEYQYGSSKDGFKAKASALSTLQRLGLLDESGSVPKCSEEFDSVPNTSEQSMDCPSIGIGIGIGNTEESLRETKSEPGFDLERIFAEYPQRPGTGHLDGIRALKIQLTTESDYHACIQAAKNYAAHIRKERTDAKFIKQFKTWCGSVEKPNWREWINPPGIRSGATLTSVPKIDAEDSNEVEKIVQILAKTRRSDIETVVGDIPPRVISAIEQAGGWGVIYYLPKDQQRNELTKAISRMSRGIA